MKAAILKEFNHIEIGEVEPEPLDVGQVLVKVESATICGAQIGEIDGSKGKDPYLPHLLGHEGCGVVIRIGAGVQRLKVGDRVVMHWRKASGINATPPRYRWRGGYVGGGWVTTFNSEAVVSENRLTPIPDDVPAEVGALMGCAVTTALGLITNEAKLKMGESIAIAGSGGVGLNVIQGAALVSAYPIIAIDRVPSKLGMTKLFGASHTVSTLKENWISSIREIVDGVDVFVDCTGSPDMIEEGYKLTVPGGRMILVGQPKYGRGLILSNVRQHYCGKTILDSQGGLTQPDVDIPRYIRLWKSERLQLDGIITHRYPLDQINEAVEKVKSGNCGRVALEMGD